MAFCDSTRASQSLPGGRERGEPKEKLIDYLWTVETETMGHDGNRARIESVVERLLPLRHEIDGRH